MEVIFKEELQRLLPGKSLKFELVQIDPNNKQSVSKVLEDIRTKRPDLIYSWGTPTTLAIAGTFNSPVVRDVPIVFTIVANPYKSQLTE